MLGLLAYHAQMPAPQTLSGRVALVTGASRGIGRAIAQRLAAHGAAIAVSSSERSREGLADTVRRIEAAGGRAVALCADLADEHARADLVARAGTALGPVDVLVNNAAAIPSYQAASRMDLAARRLCFEVNLHAPIDLVQQALPGMRERGFGRIVNIGSDTARTPGLPYPGPARFVHALTVYGASKAALERCSLGLAAELHGSGVHVNVLAPVKICASESAAEAVRQYAATRPEWVEPVEMMAEAAYRLVAGTHTGLSIASRALLQQEQCALHALDGHTPIGDAASIV